MKHQFSKNTYTPLLRRLKNYTHRLPPTAQASNRQLQQTKGAQRLRSRHRQRQQILRRNLPPINNRLYQMLRPLKPTPSPPTLAAKKDQAPPNQALYQLNLAPDEETTESNATAWLLAHTSLLKPSTPVSTAKFPEAAHRARRKKKSKRQLLPRTTEAEEVGR